MSSERRHDDEAFLQELRSRLNRAHAEASRADQPPSGLWNCVLTNHTHRKGNAMQTMKPSPMADVSPGVSPPRWMVSPARPTVYGAAAALLTLVLLGGLFIAANGWPEGSDDDVSYIVAQPSSPEATPGPAKACDVRALSIDAAMAIVENPYAGLDYERLNAAGLPAFLSSPGSPLVLMDGEGEPMAQHDEAAVRQVAAAYLACLQHGTLGQVFALMSPNAVQNTIFGQFPAFRAEVDVRAFLEANLSAPATEILMTAPWPAGVTVGLAEGPDSALMTSPLPGYPVAFIGTRGIAADGQILATSDARDHISVMRAGEGASSPVPSLGAVSLVQYPGADRWYVHDAVVTRDTSGRETETPLASPVAGTSEPATTVEIVAEPPVGFIPAEVVILAHTDVAMTIANREGLVGQPPLLENFSVVELGVSVDLDPGESRTIVINAPPGDYAIASAIPGHTEAGMAGTLHVIASATPAA